MYCVTEFQAHLIQEKFTAAVEMIASTVTSFIVF